MTLGKHNKHENYEEHVNEHAGEGQESNSALSMFAQEAELMRKEALDLDSSKYEFITNMSHEIRAPINSIIGFAEVLLDKDICEEDRSYIEKIKSSGKKLLNIINDVLDFSKIESGQLEMQIIDCSLNEMLDDLDSQLRPKAAKKNLKFDILQCSSLPKQIRTDPARLRQCLINLTDNALKFTKEGHVYINVSLDEKDDIPYIRFDIEDTATSIERDQERSNIESLAQIDEDISHEYKGSNLGLAITKQIVKLLGGNLTLQKDVNKGSVYTMIIPPGVDLNQKEAYNKYEPVNEMHDAEQKQSARILIVEDNPINQTIIQTMLEKHKFDVTIANDGQEAVDKVSDGEYDLVVMDIQMPNMTGDQAAKILRERGYKSPIIALTAATTPEDEEKCLSSGCDSFLPKPIDMKKLIRIIEEHLNSRKELSPVGADYEVQHSNELHRPSSESYKSYTAANKTDNHIKEIEL